MTWKPKRQAPPYPDGRLIVFPATATEHEITLVYRTGTAGLLDAYPVPLCGELIVPHLCPAPHGVWLYKA